MLQIHERSVGTDSPTCSSARYDLSVDLPGYDPTADLPGYDVTDEDVALICAHPIEPPRRDVYLCIHPGRLQPIDARGKIVTPEVETALFVFAGWCRRTNALFMATVADFDVARTCGHTLLQFRSVCKTIAALSAIIEQFSTSELTGIFQYQVEQAEEGLSRMLGYLIGGYFSPCHTDLDEIWSIWKKTQDMYSPANWKQGISHHFHTRWHPIFVMMGQ
jgi:hypothetical protein